MSDSSLSDTEKPNPVRVSRRRTKAVEDLRQNKQLGLSRAEEYELEANKDDRMYDILDEKEYKALKRKRKEKGAFVVDDDGTGYVDHYEEDHYFNYEENQSDKEIIGKKNSKKKRIKEFNVDESSGYNNLNHMFNNIKRTNLRSKKNKLEISKEEEAEKEMEKILESEIVSDIEENDLDCADEASLQVPEVNTHTSTPLSCPKAEKNNKKLVKEDSVKLADLCNRPLVVPKAVERIEAQFHKDINPLKPNPGIGSLDEVLFEVCSQCQVTTTKGCSCQDKSQEKVIKAFILDMFEDKYASPGSVYLFGKAVMNNSKSKRNVNYDRFQNFCIEVKNVCATFYLLPRKNLSEAKIKAGVDEFALSMTQQKFDLAAMKQRTVRKKFFFSHQMPENTIENGEYDFIEVVIPAKDLRKRHSQPTSNTVFQYIFNTQQSMIENVILNQELKGPSWMHIVSPSLAKSNISWGSTMLSVSSPKSFKRPPTEAVFNDPPFTALSISIKTVLNETKQVNEIMSITCGISRNVHVDGKFMSQESKPEFYTLVREFQGSDILKPVLNSSEPVGKIFWQRSEKSLLNLFLNKLRQVDPDIIISHGLLTFDIGLLLDRLNQLKVPQWSRIYRMRISKMPRNSRGKGKLIGRLGIDIEHVAKELLLGQKSYSMEYLARNLLSALTYNYWSGDTILKKVRKENTEEMHRIKSLLQDEVAFCFKLCDLMGVLLLTKNVSTLCGNLWNRTLSAGRAERIEYFLLHELKRRNHIFPEKYIKSLKDGKRQKYAGGLVLEPKKGLYDQNVILLLDFNSLYPSIIQEYDYCFTNSSSEDSSQDTILPGVLKRLVDRRKEVKRLMKNAKEDSKREVYNIRQKALKIIANSMYGCLGFTGSRFYTQKIAENVTAKGRELLTTAVEIVEKEFGLEVVYGDTDSIMIKTNFRNKIFDKDRKVRKDLETKIAALSKSIRKSVNSNYRVVELGEDGIFLSLLLLKKKKYAAISFTNGRIKKEVKGLDMVRRDWCFMTKKTSNKLLDILLNRNDVMETENSEEPGDSQERIMEVLRTLKEELETDKEASRSTLDVKVARKLLNKYVITKGLNKAIGEYERKGNSSTLPHVKVAKSLITSGTRVKVGDHISYLHAKKLDYEGRVIENCVLHPDQFIEINKKGANMVEIDERFYIDQQLLPPIERLLIVVEEVNLGQIYKEFGVNKMIPHTNDIEIFSLNENQVDNFAGCEKFTYTCRGKQCFKEFSLAKETKVCPGCDRKVNWKLAKRLITLKTQNLIEDYYKYKVYFKNHNLKTSNNIALCGTKILPQESGTEEKIKRKITEERLLSQLKYFAHLISSTESDPYWQNFIQGNKYNYVKGKLFQKAFGIETLKRSKKLMLRNKKMRIMSL